VDESRAKPGHGGCESDDRGWRREASALLDGAAGAKDDCPDTPRRQRVSRVSATLSAQRPPSHRATAGRPANVCR